MTQEHAAPAAEAVRKAVIRRYDAAAHKADVQLVGSHPTVLTAVRLATDIPAADVVAGRQCTVLFLDPANQDDAVILTIHGALPSTPSGATVAASATVVAETTFGLASAAGAASPYSRGDHTHGSPTDPVPAHAAAADPHTVYGALAQAETWAALQTFSAGIKLAAAQAIYDSTDVARVTLDAAAAQPVAITGPLLVNTGPVGATLTLKEVTDESTYPALEGLGSGGTAAIHFGRIIGGTTYGLFFESTANRFGGTLAVSYASPGVILTVASIGASAGAAIDSSPLSAELDLTATAAQTGKVWAALKSRLTYRGTQIVPDANAIDALVTRENTHVGAQKVRGILAGWVNNAALGAFGTKEFYGLDILAASGSVALSSTTDAFGVRARDQGALGGRNVWAFHADAISGGANRVGLRLGSVVGGTLAYLLELGAGPTMRLKDRGVGGWTPAAGETPLWLEEGATPTFRQLKTKDGAAIGAGDRVCVL